MTAAAIVPIPDGSEFPLANLPYGVFSCNERVKHIGVALGEHVVDLHVLHNHGKLCVPGLEQAADCLCQGSLNAFIGVGRSVWSATRAHLQQLLSADGEHSLARDPDVMQLALVKQCDVTMHLPVHVGDYTDFYVSLHHAFNVGALFRGPGQELQPNWRHLPVGYHGRASSIVVSGTDVARPRGQRKPAGATSPEFGPSAAVDFELEVGAIVGPGNALGQPIPVGTARDHIFGYVLLNDWSARDIQAWEYVPLGPFNGKNWATQISPWVVTAEALEPFMVPAEPQDPPPLPYLHLPPERHMTPDVHLTVDIIPGGQRSEHTVCRTNFKHMYWTFEQMVAHHTAGGCNLQPGDLLGSGTVSGPDPEARACLLEITRAGKEALTLGAAGSGAVRRMYLEDGDEVVLRGWCAREGVPHRIGFGECRGKLLPCPPYGAT